MRENKSFDDILKSKLNEIPPIDHNGDWSFFEQILNAESDFHQLEHDIEFDEQVQRKVESYSAPFVQGHWYYMKELLEIILRRKIKIYTVKSFELCAVLLIIFTIFNLAGFKQNRQIQEKSEIIAETFPIKNFNSDLLTFGNAKNNNTSNKNTETVNPEINIREIDRNPKITKSTFLKSGKIPAYVSAQTIGILAEAQQIIRPEIIKDFADLNFENENLSDENNIISLSGNTAEIISIADIVNSDFQSDMLVIPYLINDKEGFTLNSLQNQYHSDLSEDISKKLEQTKILTNESLNSLVSSPESKDIDFVQRSFGIFYSTDVNLINTPFDKVYSVASYNKEAFNQSYGFNFSIRKNYYSWEAGLKYANLHYQPKLIKEQHNQIADNFFETSLDEITFGILSLRVGAKLHLVKNKSWDTYVNFGTSMNLITDSEYEITTKIKQGRNANRSPDSDLRLTDEKKFTPGYFENGNFKDNYFVTAGFGFGIQKTLYQRTSIYLQSQYNRHLLSADMGIGPNKDKIHTLSLQIGARVVLN